MPKVWSATSQDGGFSVVEVLLAATVFGFIATALIGAIIYGRASTADGGARARANMVADEGVEAVRNIRDAGYANLTNGTYGLVQSGNTWTLSGSSDVTSSQFTRSVTIADNGSNRKLITSNVSWSSAGGTGQVSVVSELTNWIASLAKLWSAASQYGTLNLTGTIAGYRVDSAGSYAYMVRNNATGPNFFIINISNPASPTVTGSLTLTGTPNNVMVNGNYAYVSNGSSTAELQIVNVTTPTAPTLSGTYNATGNAGGRGVYVVGTTVYLSRAANATSDEFVIINAANPASPARLGGYALNVNMNEVYVSGTTAYLATASDTQEVLVINVTTPSSLALGTAINLSGTTDATSIAGFGTTIAVGQGTIFNTVTNTTALAPTFRGSVTMPGAIQDVDVDSGHNYAFAGINSATGEFKVVNLATITAPAILRTVDMTGSFILNGVSYNSTYDIVAGASSNTAGEAVVFGPN